MRFKSTFYKLSVLLLLNQCYFADLNASQRFYCNPTFTNGCNLWSNQSITLDSINWSMGTDACTAYNYLSYSTTLSSGATYPMSVSNGSWCGCAVWIDFDNNEDFTDNENLYYHYANISSDYTYNFNITIPPTVTSGTYRMRVVAGWGTDCFTISANGFGPCGIYEYGNFDDFTVNIVNSPVGLDNLSGNSISAIEAFPNPLVSSVTVLINETTGNESQLQLLDITGNIIRSIPISNKKTEIDMNGLSKGVYILRYTDGKKSQSIRLVN